MLMMRPNPREAIASTVALMNSIGVSMLASMAAIHCSRSQSLKSPGGGPPALVTTMSKSLPGPPTACQMASRPAGVVTSLATPTTVASPPNALSLATASYKGSSVRAATTTLQPACTKCAAQPKPKPLLAPHTNAHLPVRPKSIACSLRFKLKTVVLNRLF